MGYGNVHVVCELMLVGLFAARKAAAGLLPGMVSATPSTDRTSVNGAAGAAAGMRLAQFFLQVRSRWNR